MESLLPFGLFTILPISIILMIESCDVSSIVFSIMWALPLLASYYAITTYNGHDKDQVYLRVIIQRCCFIVYFQSIPLACIFSISIRLLLTWCISLLVIIFAFRLQMWRLQTFAKQHDISPVTGKPQYIPALTLYHPHAHQRAGGELVLWRLIKALASNQSFLNMFENHHQVPTLTLLSNVVPSFFIQNASKEDVKSNSSPTSIVTSKSSSSSTSSVATVTSDNLYDVIEDAQQTSQSIFTPLLSTKSSPIVSQSSSHSSTHTPVAPPAPANIDINHVSNIWLIKAILRQVHNTFNIDLSHDVTLLNDPITQQSSPSSTSSPSSQISELPSVSFDMHFLRHTEMSDSSNYPRFTLILQTANAMCPILYYLIGVIVSSWTVTPSSPQQTLPLFVFDTAGYPAIALICRFFGIPCGAYVHYPIIQHDMLDRNLAQVSTVTTTADIEHLNNVQHGSTPQQQQASPLERAKQTIRHAFRVTKHVYFSALLNVYTGLLSYNSCLFANGSWTFNHLASLMGRPAICAVLPGQPSLSPSSSASSSSSSTTTAIASQSTSSSSTSSHERPVTANSQILPINVVLQAAGYSQNDNNNTSGPFQQQLIVTSPHRFPPLVENVLANVSRYFIDSRAIILDRLYPPCNVSAPARQQTRLSQYQQISTYLPIFVVLGQYRPEKQQLMLLYAFHTFLQTYMNNALIHLPIEYRNKDREQLTEIATNLLRVNQHKIMLVFIGTFRPEDITIVQTLYDYIHNNSITIDPTLIGSNSRSNNNNINNNKTDPLDSQQSLSLDSLPVPTVSIFSIPLSPHVAILINAPFATLQGIAQHACCGLHAMVDEHFGIGVVELMCFCLTIIAHRSAGPFQDIIVPAHILHDKSTTSTKSMTITTPALSASHVDPQACGFVAATSHEYTQAMLIIMEIFRQASASSSSPSSSSSSSSSTNSFQNDSSSNSSSFISPAAAQALLLQMSANAQRRAITEFGLNQFDLCVQNRLIPVLDACMQW